jgi:3-oxoacyl-[acyl-carrier-protein] synthase II
MANVRQARPWPRALVTGLGATTSVGAGRASLLEAMRSGRHGIGPLTLFDASGYRSRLVGQAPDPAPPARLGRFGRCSRADLFALEAAAEAALDAGLDGADLEGAAVVLGTGTGGWLRTERYLERLRRLGEHRAPAAWLVAHQPAGSTDVVANRLGARGARASLMTACSSSATAIGLGADLIRLGRASVVLAGGTDSLSRLTLGGFSALRALDEGPCRPFHRERGGLTLGEGAAVLVLEEEGRARRRGARVYAELAGYGTSADAHHLTAPDPEGRGAVLCMEAAMRDAGLLPEEIDYVNAHGTGTPQNDAVEAAALRAVFGARSASLPVSSTKAMTGHALGAAGAIEAAICVLAISEGLIPPTLRLDDPAPECALGHVALEARPARLSAVLSNSFAFGGNNTTLALRGMA